jgi:proteasome assembly chaperone (PAC2) family protein
MVLTVEFTEKPKLNDPILIEGLPGIGFVANIATLHHRLHQQAGEVLEQHAKGQVDALEAGLSALNDLGTSLLAQLEALVHTPLR